MLCALSAESLDETRFEMHGKKLVPFHFGKVSFSLFQMTMVVVTLRAQCMQKGILILSSLPCLFLNKYLCIFCYKSICTPADYFLLPLDDAEMFSKRFPQIYKFPSLYLPRSLGTSQNYGCVISRP